MERIAKLLFEIGMLKRTPRTGFRFLGTGRESVAEHSYRVIFIGYTLAKLSPGVNQERIMELCLVHDIIEARTGDLNYVYKDYVCVDSEGALGALTKGLQFGQEIKKLVMEFNSGETEESRLARDADQLDLLLELKEQFDLGNAYAKKWLDHVAKRMITPVGRKLAEEIFRTDHCSWWFEKYEKKTV